MGKEDGVCVCVCVCSFVSKLGQPFGSLYVVIFLKGGNPFRFLYENIFESSRPILANNNPDMQLERCQN